MGAPARIERARVGSKPTALPLSYGAVTEAAGLEPADGSRRLRASNALPFQLGHASRGGRRGSRTPKARGPTRFRDGIPRPWQSFQMVTPAGFQPALPRVRAGSSPLSYGAVQCGRQGSNLRRPAFQAGALPAELRPRGSERRGCAIGRQSKPSKRASSRSSRGSRSPLGDREPVRGRRGWTRTSSLLRVKQALCAIELLAPVLPQAGDRRAATASREDSLKRPHSRPIGLR